MSSEISDIRQLLADGAWLRRLAGRLVCDPACADDAVQEALIAASRREMGSPSRRWLARVMQNFVRQDQRQSSRRSRHEAVVAKSGVDDSGHEVVARLEI